MYIILLDLPTKQTWGRGWQCELQPGSRGGYFWGAALWMLGPSLERRCPTVLLNVVMVKLQGLLVLFNRCQSRTFSAILSPDGKLPEGREDVLTIVVFLGLKCAVSLELHI